MFKTTLNKWINQDALFLEDTSYIYIPKDGHQIFPTLGINTSIL